MLENQRQHLAWRRMRRLLKREILDLESQIESLNAENFSLAANQCHHGYPGEHGHHCCRYQDHVRLLEERVNVSADLIDAMANLIQRLNGFVDTDAWKAGITGDLDRLRGKLVPLFAKLGQSIHKLDRFKKRFSDERPSSCEEFPSLSEIEELRRGVERKNWLVIHRHDIAIAQKFDGTWFVSHRRFTTETHANVDDAIDQAMEWLAEGVLGEGV